MSVAFFGARRALSRRRAAFFLFFFSRGKIHLHDGADLAESPLMELKAAAEPRWQKTDSGR